MVFYYFISFTGEFSYVLRGRVSLFFGGRGIGEYILKVLFVVYIACGRFG